MRIVKASQEQFGKWLLSRNDQSDGNRQLQLTILGNQDG